jgi:hypothetical protein
LRGSGPDLRLRLLKAADRGMTGSIFAVSYKVKRKVDVVGGGGRRMLAVERDVDTSSLTVLVRSDNELKI